MLRFDIRSNVKQMKKQLDDFARNQVPFATAQAINVVAAKVQTAERDEMGKTFDRPTPFTVNSVGVKKARKANPEATVFVKPVAAKYLKPYEKGGTRALPGSSRATLKPNDDALLNQYGNLPRKGLARLRNRADVFIGKVQTAEGEIDGVWQRSSKPAKATKASKAGKARGPKRGLQKNTGGKLKLLIRFTDPQPVKQRLPFAATAQAIIDRDFEPAFNAALDKAIANAKK